MRPAGTIDIYERDYFLDLHSDAWPKCELPLLRDSPPGATRDNSWKTEGWSLEKTEGPRFISRVISRSVPEQAERSLEEVALRFPSCPLFGIQRERQYQVDLDPINYHTLRLLRPASRPDDWKAERVFIMFNGLNETDHLGFYYDLAGLLLADQNTACILCALPGHLMRYPMVGRFAEKPLNRFIGDPSDLFRQYLRAMLEAQWLLSILVPISYYPVVPGTVLLGSNNVPGKGRCDPETLSREIYSSWLSIWQSSAGLLDPSAGPSPSPRGGEVREINILQTVKAIRELIGWEALEKPLTGLQPPEQLPSPKLHVIGYSLGGYLAQSVFFTWPFALGSCTTICSGGALHEIRPTKFAHEEEWRAVTNGLKYELESGMLQRRLRVDGSDDQSLVDRSICGISPASFSSFFRIFNDVFLQDPNGSYRSRVSEFAPRLLFMVGGNDPIVTTRSVIDASPREGINLIEIANLSHFVAIERGEWGAFWLPALSKLLISFADRTELLLSNAVLENLWTKDVDGPADGLSWPMAKNFGKPKLRRESQPLGSERFQVELMEAVESLSRDKEGFLFILRNRIPTALMGPRLLKRRGTIPHFEDRQIRDYWWGLKDRREKMLGCAERLTLVLPKRLKEWFVTPGAILSAKSEPSSRSVPDAETLLGIWGDFLDAWEPTGALFSFDAHDSSRSGGNYQLESLIRRDSRTPGRHPILNTLPDVWISLSGEVVRGIIGDAPVTRKAVTSGFLAQIERIYQEMKKGPDEITPELTPTRRWMEDGKLRLIRISSASSNSRFLGERIWSLEGAMDLLLHSALALSRSIPVRPGDLRH